MHGWLAHSAKLSSHFTCIFFMKVGISGQGTGKWDMFMKNCHPCCKLKNLQNHFFWDKLITNRVISKKVGQNLCFNGRAGVRRLKSI